MDVLVSSIARGLQETGGVLHALLKEHISHAWRAGQAAHIRRSYGEGMCRPQQRAGSGQQGKPRLAVTFRSGRG